MPTPTIKKPNQHFDAVLWTGDGTSSKTISSYNFAPDLVWAKNRSDTSIGWSLYDTIRGAGAEKELATHQNYAEGGDNHDTYGYLSAFTSNGFTGSDGSGSPNYYFNKNSSTYVAYGWKAGGASTVNTSGSISSNVSVNTTAGFSVVTYTGNLTAAGNATVGHGLGVAPKMVITKRRSGTSQWMVWHTGLTNATYALQLQSTDAQVNTAGAGWSGGTVSDPTSTTFGTNYLDGRNVNGSTYVAYCWAEIAGFSKFTSYTGNGSSDGPFIYCGFRPKFVIIKMYSGAVGQSWALQDTSRSTYNASIYRLQAESSNAENSSTSNSIDILSNGFKIRTTDNEYNNSSYSYIVAAFAENPFKYSNAR